MAEERNTENFALGLIVAAIVFLLFRREFSKFSSGSAKGGAGGAGGVKPSGGSCGCSGASSGSSGKQAFPDNPGISPGAVLGDANMPPSSGRAASSGPITEYAWSGSGSGAYSSVNH